ncbi:hypothetical protein ACROAE_20485 [Shewanella sp. MF05960]|uniref:hypothetical protein n=1 Tax=Shewanella sp. MF05960 TaxID=3434874 RepID=UPI003D7B2F1B
MKFTLIILTVLLLTVSHFAVASDCIQIKVIKPITVQFSSDDVKSKRFDQVKLLHEDKSGICLPTPDTYVLAYDMGVPYIAARLKGHTPDITLIKKDEIEYVLIKYHTGNKLQVLKGYQYIDSTLVEIPNLTLSSNLSEINIVNGSIEVNKSEFVNDKVINQLSYYDFDLTGIHKKH